MSGTEPHGNISRIRNFCIIAHIDHGKSTLADRLLEYTNTVSKRQMKDQLLDQMDLERERGITIKLQPVRMDYRLDGQDYILNLIDTPGHVDFTYEVSRSLACCEGAILVVDSTQGIEAQTLANVHLAKENNLVIIPVVNKIDLPNSDRQRTAEEIKNIFDFKDEDILYASGKTGEGVDEILRAVVRRLPGPRLSPEQGSDLYLQLAKDAEQHYSKQDAEQRPLRALIFDSVYDVHRGVIAFIRIFQGNLPKNQGIKMIGTDTQAQALEVGYFRPQFEAQPVLHSGEVGYVVTGLRDVSKARVGDTITLKEAKDNDGQQVKALPGYKQVKPMVYATIFPTSAEDYPLLRDAMEKLKLNDAALVFEPENIASIGFGFRTGFLGLLHMDIVQERLSREYGLDLVLTAPSVAYKIEITNGTEKVIHTPAEWPDPATIKEVYEPWMAVDILTPQEYIGPVLEIVNQRRGLNKDIKYLGKDRVHMLFEMPLANIITDFYDKLKSVSSGYASLNYDFLDNRPGDLSKVYILVGGEKVEALAIIAHRSVAERDGRALIEKLKELIPRQQFEIALQASIGGKVIARESIKAYRKDVTGYLYGGDVTRKMKLLNKQKKGKKRMKKIGKVEIPQEAFLAVLKK